jgi:hypothetical protein
VSEFENYGWHSETISHCQGICISQTKLVRDKVAAIESLLSGSI